MKGLSKTNMIKYIDLTDESASTEFLEKLKSAIYILDLSIEAVVKIAKGFSSDPSSNHYSNAITLLDGLKQGRIEAESTAVMLELKKLLVAMKKKLSMF